MQDGDILGIFLVDVILYTYIKYIFIKKMWSRNEFTTPSSFSFFFSSTTNSAGCKYPCHLCTIRTTKSFTFPAYSPPSKDPTPIGCATSEIKLRYGFISMEIFLFASFIVLLHYVFFLFGRAK